MVIDTALKLMPIAPNKPEFWESKHCAESISLLYLNPPYDLESGQTNNQRLELVFLEHTYRWLKPGGFSSL
jgi:hypothetical protein